MPHERFPSARPRWFTPNATPCRVDGEQVTTLKPIESRERRFVSLDLSYIPSKLFHEPLWADVIDLRARREELLAQLHQQVIHVTIDHYRHAEWLVDLLKETKPPHHLHVWLQVSTPDSFGGMRAGNDATDLAHGAHQLFTTHHTPITIRGFITTTDVNKVSNDPERIKVRDQRLLYRSLEWAASEDKRLEGLQELPVSEQKSEPLPAVSGDFIATVVSRPSLDIGVIDLGKGHLGATSNVTFPDHNDVTLSRISEHRAELRLGYNAQNLRIGDQVRILSHLVHSP